MGKKRIAKKVKYKRNIAYVVIPKKCGHYANKIYTIGATEGLMIAYVTKPNNNNEQAYIYPIEHHLKDNEDVMQELQIGSITCRWSENGEDIQMPSKPGSRYPFHCFIRVVGEVRQNTVQERNTWAHNMCRYFNQLGSDVSFFGFPSSFIVCRENPENDDDLLPVAKYLLNNNVISLIHHIYPDVNLEALAGEDTIVRSFWGEDLFEEGKRLMIEEGQIED